MKDDMKAAIALIKKGMKQKEVKSEFLRFNKMNKITWIKKWTELKKIINKKNMLAIVCRLIASSIASS